MSQVRYDRRRTSTPGEDYSVAKWRHTPSNIRRKMIESTISILPSFGVCAFPFSHGQWDAMLRSPGLTPYPLTNHGSAWAWGELEFESTLGCHIISSSFFFHFFSFLVFGSRVLANWFFTHTKFVLFFFFFLWMFLKNLHLGFSGSRFEHSECIG